LSMKYRTPWALLSFAIITRYSDVIPFALGYLIVIALVHLISPRRLHFLVSFF
jgi:hypothetical protein